MNEWIPPSGILSSILLDWYSCSGKICCLHLQGRRPLLHTYQATWHNIPDEQNLNFSNGEITAFSSHHLLINLYILLRNVNRILVFWYVIMCIGPVGKFQSCLGVPSITISSRPVGQAPSSLQMGLNCHHKVLQYLWNFDQKFVSYQWKWTTSS